MVGTVLKRLCGTDSADKDDAMSSVSIRQQAMGILADTDEKREWFSSEAVDAFCIEVTVEQLEQLDETDWFDTVSVDGSRAVSFAKRYPNATDTIVRVTDSNEEFTVTLEAMTVTEITNETIQSFCRAFSHSIETTFDPLAEKREHPRMTVQPW